MGRTKEQWLLECELARQEAINLGWNYVRIPLTQNQFTLVDIEDYEETRDSGPWCAAWKDGSNSFYAERQSPDGKRMTQYLARFLFDPSGESDVDHVSRDSLDNRRSNLRQATRSQNQMNKRPRYGTSSRFKGVSWHKARGKWAAEIRKDGKGVWLGRFAEEEDAARAYDAAAKKHFGEYALTNEDLGLYEGD